MIDLLDATAELVDIASVSLGEAVFADHLEAAYLAIDGLTVDRVGDNVVARTMLGRATRLLLVGHSDTVPPNGNDRARIEGDTLWGVGAADMKGALAVMLALAGDITEPTVDVTHVIYCAEEIAAEHNGLAQLYRDAPELLAGDVAIVGEPTDATVEAGCQGTIRVEVAFAGVAAHSARPWMGSNAIHRMAPALAILDAYEERRPQLGGCAFREAMQAVGVVGGVAGNVVPDSAVLTVNHRFAPDRSIDEALAHVEATLAPALGPDDTLTLVDGAPAAAPATDHPLVAAMVEREGLEVRAKLGWTDVARLASHGVPAVNFGPGDSRVAHHRDEHVTRSQLDRCAGVLRGVLTH
ncbi:MAG TPA: succinyl-diaminopimelate desuccinylase [Acidimicrobiales bacterium]|nr:succinyl-diaminopimelate desuccinylase [Acidimicrobiales bacterium]